MAFQLFLEIFKIRDHNDKNQKKSHLKILNITDYCTMKKYRIEKKLEELLKFPGIF